MFQMPTKGGRIGIIHTRLSPGGLLYLLYRAVPLYLVYLVYLLYPVHGTANLRVSAVPLLYLLYRCCTAAVPAVPLYLLYRIGSKHMSATIRCITLHIHHHHAWEDVRLPQWLCPSYRGW